jgi:phosphoribosylformylglycinamidine synthase
MIFFAKSNSGILYAIEAKNAIDQLTKEKLAWLLDGTVLDASFLKGYFVGPRKEMVTPWSTNAVEITQNMGIAGLVRIEEFSEVNADNAPFDAMLQRLFVGLDQDLFTISAVPEPVIYVKDIAAYNKAEGLALNEDEVKYLDSVVARIGRNLTDSEVFGFSQVNSEHCRHKIFNGQFIIDGIEKESTLFKLIRKTAETNPNTIVSAYKDNVAFVTGPKAEQFAPASSDKPDYFGVKDFESVLSLKAETHNFPTTVEPFNGAATGAGGEIRDRLAGGKGSLPMAGTAVYMTSYSRLEKDRTWEQATTERPWLYQTPMDILIKASNGASDFGNKFGQPLICGSVLTFEHFEQAKKYGFDKVIMLAGGVGFGKLKDAQKEEPKVGEKIVVMGGDNYRIGMGGSAVSSVATGEFSNAIELNAVQRSNPEMQKRVANAIRAMVELDDNPIVSIHDHGAGGHLNCLSELVEATGGNIDLNALPVGDPTLSAKEIVGNESQERMGLLIGKNDTEYLANVAQRERAPFYVVGETTGDMHFRFEDKKTGQNPIDIKLEDMFGKPPRTVMTDVTVPNVFDELAYDKSEIENYLKSVLQLEAVASKDWLTNKVDRSVTGKVAKQQTCGELQIPLNNLGVMAIDYRGKKGIATSIGHAPVAALVDERAGSVMAIAEALTNIVWAPIEGGLQGIALSANWMWPCKNKGEDARLYNAVEAVSDFAIALGINIPTGKDSLSMTQKYGKEDVVYAPGTVIISAIGEVTDIRKVISPVLNKQDGTSLLYIDFSSDALKLGGSTLGQVVNKLGTDAPTVTDAAYFKNAFAAVQTLVAKGLVLAGHDVSSGGLVTTLLEMTFPNIAGGLEIDLAGFAEKDTVKILFAENSAIVIQINNEAAVNDVLAAHGVKAIKIGTTNDDKLVNIKHEDVKLSLDITELRQVWTKTSYLLDKKQTLPAQAESRFSNLAKQPIVYQFKPGFSGKLSEFNLSFDRKPSGIKAAIIREKGSNGDREMAYSMYLAGFDVKDVHMTDLISGRETLEDVNYVVFVGGFSNSDVLGSAKGWAGAFLYNEKAMNALKNFFKRDDTLSLGVCNGCQLMVELGLIYPEHDIQPKMLHNDSHKFESSFVTLDVMDNKSVMLQNMNGSRLGLWVAHGEGKFQLPKAEVEYAIPLKYSYTTYPGNPNGSAYDAAGIVSKDGRHLAMMPHLERAIFPWQCAYYPEQSINDEVTPWIQAFVNARKWVEEKVK